MPVIVGIIPIGSGLTLRDEYPLVQSRCNYSVVDVYTIAEIVQDYCSAAPINRDVEYVFPLPPSAAVCSFKAVIDDTKTIKGVVKEKGEAKKAFDQAVAQGKTAGLLQQEHADVFRVSLGNIKPNTKISVHISFVSIVPHDGSSPQTLRIIMPTAIAPRYGTPPTNIPWFRQNAQNRLKLSVSVQMNKPITSVSSPSHPIGLTLGCHQRELAGDHDPSKAFVYLGESTLLDKDIVIIISAQGLDTPSCSVERWLKSEGAEETTDAYALTLVPKFDLPALPRQEYIFLVDRSGSMGGGRITAVKAALQILLRSLPSRNSSFNIVSFGSSYTSLWPVSQAYSEESMEQASKHVDGFDADYGGTELRSAIEFAFSSRQDIKAPQDEKVPTSVFVLTDGEAWDLDGIIHRINHHCNNAKESCSLLRTFTLGVGNHVSTAMCEGIARAGKGTAVFVAEGEKPDAKLMGLLKAARGGVIEDLAVEWGNPEETKEEEDDFEMVPSPSNPEAVVTLPAPQSQPALSLFDESHVDTPAEVGAQKAIVLLGPPPKIQQAPKSDKLPIPLYPGFRCSIFAIVKRSSNPGPHSANVKITGKVMGRDVVLQIPVSPASVHSGVVEGKVEGGRLLHTLAAKALIQSFEDLPKTPENRAQIERLGKRYSLASSVTSFVAIDNETNDEVKKEEHTTMESDNDFMKEDGLLSLFSRKKRKVKKPAIPSASAVTTGYHASAMDSDCGLSAISLPAPPAPLRHQHAPISMPLSVHDEEDLASELAELDSDQLSFSHHQTSLPMDQSTDDEELADLQRQIALDALNADIAELSAYADNISASISQQGQQLTQLSATTEASEAKLSRPSAKMARLDPVTKAASTKKTGLMSYVFRSRSSITPMVAAPKPSIHKSIASSEPLYAGPGSFGQPVMPQAIPTIGTVHNLGGTTSLSPPSVQQSLSVESIARTQKFNGSFPFNDAHIRFIVGADRLSQARELPPILKQIGGVDETKMAVWITVLTYVCLHTKFEGEKDSWEMLVEKAKEYVEKELMGLGLEDSLVEKTLGELESAASTLF
ncbi:hypothetical protein FRC17_009457 [Serendipita sp. 399]|nr:hypothetical protein FRC17_009457 [Serendipita sp. 399]